MIIDRNIISENFRYRTNEFNHRYGFNEERITNRDGLFKRIDYWKYILYTECGMRKGMKIALGITQIGIDYFSIVFAGMELGLRFVVLDFSIHADRIGINDYKSDAFGKIDLFLHHFPDGNETLEYYSKKSEKIIHLYDVNDFIVENTETFRNIAKRRPKPEDDLILCASGTAKRIVHSHKFMYELVQRNKQRFSGSVMHIKNLHHKGTMAMFFLPTFASDSVTCHYGLGYNTVDDGMIKIATIANQFQVENIIFTCAHELDLFIKQSIERKYKYKEFKAYTLSFIQDCWQQYFDTLGISSIENLFGYNETGGPLFIGKMYPNQEFDSNKFEQFDNFYKFTLDKQNMLVVNVPIYDNEFFTNNEFESQNNFWIYKDNYDTSNIKNVKVDTNLPIRYGIDGLCVNDTVFNKIYLAIWTKMPDKVAEIKVNVLNKELQKKYDHRVQIDQYHVLNKIDFQRGINLDHELVREWFRNNT
jgi:hypothetical protein